MFSEIKIAIMGILRVVLPRDMLQEGVQSGRPHCQTEGFVFVTAKKQKLLVLLQIFVYPVAH